MTGPRHLPTVHHQRGWSRAEAHRWLDAHVGCDITTRQTRPDGMRWEPGVRTLSKTGAKTWALDGSEVRLTANDIVLDITDDLLLLEWVDEDGTQIHITAYRVVWPEVDDDEAFDIIDDHADCGDGICRADDSCDVCTDDPIDQPPVRCLRCGQALTAADPVVTTLGPRCRRCWTV